MCLWYPPRQTRVRESLVEEHSVSDSGMIYLKQGDGPVVLEVNNGVNSGTWGFIHLCEPGSFAASLQQKIDNEDSEHSDDSGINGIIVGCYSEAGNKIKSISSEISSKGWISGPATCPSDYYIVQIRLKVQALCTGCDNTGVNLISVKCRGPGLSGNDRVETYQAGLDEKFGSWGAWSAECKSGWAVCGVTTRIQNDYSGDDIAVTDIRLICCDA